MARSTDVFSAPATAKTISRAVLMIGNVAVIRHALSRSTQFSTLRHSCSTTPFLPAQRDPAGGGASRQRDEEAAALEDGALGSDGEATRALYGHLAGIGAHPRGHARAGGPGRPEVSTHHCQDMLRSALAGRRDSS